MKYRNSYKKHGSWYKKSFVSMGYKNRCNVRQIIRYYGGKALLTPKIIKVIKWLVEEFGCNVYGELCAGGARTLLNIPYGLFDKKIYNEFSIGLCNLFSCVKDPESCRKLIDVLQNLPYDKDWFEYAKINRDKPELDILDGAALTYINVMQSRNADMHNFKLGDNETLNRKFIRQYYNQIKRINLCTEVLADTTIINGNMLNIIKQLNDYKNVLSYIDPSYHPLTRADGALNIYPYDMTQEEHIEMVKILHETKMAVILSGYDPAQYGCNDYEPLNPANGWVKKSLGFVHRPSSNKSGYSSKKEEFIWIKYPTS